RFLSRRGGERAWESGGDVFHAKIQRSGPNQNQGNPPGELGLMRIDPEITASEEAFRQVIAHWTMLNAYVRSIVHNPHLTEDTLSDVAIAIARSWPRYDPSRPFGPWSRTIARRVALENLARRGLRPVLLDESALEAL